MSYMNYYKHYNLLNINISYPEEISTESFSFSKTVEVIKKFLIKVKEFIQNFLKKLLNGFKAIIAFLFKRKNKDNEILNRLTTEDKYTIYKQSLLKYIGFIKLNSKLSLEDTDNLQVYKDTLIGPNGRTKFFINKDGSIIDLDMMEKEYDELYNDIIENKHIGSDETLRKRVERDEIGKTVTNTNDLRNVNIDSLGEIINPNNIYKFENRLKQLYSLTEDVNRKRSELLGDLNRDTNILDPERDYRIINFKKMLVVLVAKFKIYQSIIGFYRMVSHELNQFTFDEPCPKDLTLYHLSFDGGLPSVLTPKYPLSANYKTVNSYEILPKRISFAPTIEGCYYGLADIIKDNKYYYPQNQSEIKYTDMYCYQAVLDDKSRKIKDVYMRDSVFDYDTTKEVALTTNTKIKLLGKITITMGPSDHMEIKGITGSFKPPVFRFVKYEYV